MTFHRIPLAIFTLALVTATGGVATALAASSSTTPTSTATVSQALPGQGSIVGGALLGSSSPTVLPSFATTTAAASTTPGKGILSEHSKLRDSSN